MNSKITKKIVVSIMIVLAISLSFSFSHAQSPTKMSYQAVIRNNANALVTSTLIGMRISILQGSASGTEVYSETLSPTTNANGLVTIEIGNGAGFATINWANGPYFIKTETDPTGGTNYTITGTSQLLSVPYSLNAKTAETADYNTLTNLPTLNIANWNTAYGWGNHATAGYLTSYTETDPLFTASPANGISATNITNWNTAYGWGNHSGLYRPVSWVPAWTDITGKPTTLAGYGITDAMSTSHPANVITSTNISNWNTAYGWGNHASAGYLTSYTETDPVWTAAITNYYTKTNMQTNGASQLHFNNLTNKPTTLSGYGITDAMSTSHAANGITATNITNWNTAYGWGNHASAGYLTSSWTGSANLVTLGTITTGTWHGTAIAAAYIDVLPASKITSGVFDNARINWAAPGTIGSTTASSGAFTSLSASNGLNVSNGTINIRPSGSGGTNGYVLTTDGTGNVTWQAPSAASLPVTTHNADYTILTTDGLIISNGGCTFTFPTAASAGVGKIIYLYSKVSSITLLPPVGNTIWDASGNSHTNPSTMTTYSGQYISDGVNTWYEVTK